MIAIGIIGGARRTLASCRACRNSERNMRLFELLPAVVIGIYVIFDFLVSVRDNE